jgi:hypothetical protein
MSVLRLGGRTVDKSRAQQNARQCRAFFLSVVAPWAPAVYKPQKQCATARTGNPDLPGCSQDNSIWMRSVVC